MKEQLLYHLLLFGRTQEILYEINKLKEETEDEEFRRKYKTLMKASVYVDSPLAISATEVFKENTNLFEPEVKEEIEKGDNPLEFPGLEFTRTSDESKALNEDKRPSIIISASRNVRSREDKTSFKA